MGKKVEKTSKKAQKRKDAHTRIDKIVKSRRVRHCKVCEGALVLLRQQYLHRLSVYRCSKCGLLYGFTLIERVVEVT